MQCCSSLWEGIRRCCCSASGIDHDLLAPPSLDSSSSGLGNSGYNDSDILDDLQYNDPSNPTWTPHIQLRLQDSPSPGDQVNCADYTRFSEVDLGDGPPNLRDDAESGYGYSLHDSLGSQPLVSVANTKPDSEVFKVTVTNSLCCWFVLRRKHEFLHIQEIITQKINRPSVPRISETGSLTAMHLDDFIQKIMTDSKAVNLPEVREFLQLDRFNSSSSDESSDSIPIIKPKLPIHLQLDPSRLLPPSAPSPLRKQYKNEPITTQPIPRPPDIPLDIIQLGCTTARKTPADFEFLSVIGKGSFGKVMLAKLKDDNKVYAVKVLNKKMIIRRNETAHVLSERSVLIKVMKHPFLVTLHYAFTTSSKIFFVLDYVNGGELFFHLQKERTFSEPRARFYAAEILCAMEYMHSMGIMYRDLKPENILLDSDGHVVLTDFGLCKEGLQNSSSKTGTFCGTPEYLAPEILLKQAYSRAVDWWTLGAVMYEMMYGLPPFYSRDTTAMYEAILHKPLKLKQTISPAARDILSKLLQKFPLERLGSGPRDAEDLKTHEFFKVIDWAKVANRQMKPPFVPKTTSDTDTRNIDPIFTREDMPPVSVSPTGISASVQAVDHYFQGFSYAPPLDEQELDVM